MDLLPVLESLPIVPAPAMAESAPAPLAEANVPLGNANHFTANLLEEPGWRRSAITPSAPTGWSATARRPRRS